MYLLSDREVREDELFAPPYVLPRAAYESELERRFIHHAVKYFAPGIEVLPQHRVGRRRLDFYAVSPSGRRIGFECDGVAYHASTIQRERDEARDDAILSSGAVDVIYRLRGKDLWFRPEDCFFAIAHWDGSLFSPRGLTNLGHLASTEIRSLDDYREWVGFVAFRYKRSDDEAADQRDIADFHLVRRARSA